MNFKKNLTNYKMTTEITKSPLVQILETSGIEKTKGEIVLEKFTHFFQQASEWETKVKALVITDASQIREMKMAREGRLALRDIRVAAEKAKDKLKEDSLRESKFIQSIYNLIEGTIKPLENELLEKEKFAENLEKERIAKLKKERIELLTPWVADVNHYWLEGMSDSDFKDLLEGSKLAHETRVENERKAEQERIEKEQAEAAERERIRLENERLKAEAEEKEKALAAERLEREKELAEAWAAQQAQKEQLERDMEKREAIRNLNSARFTELLQLGFKYPFDDLGDMTDFAYNKMLAEHQKSFKEKQAKEAKIKAEQDAILAKEREAREKLEAEKLAEENRKKAEEKARLDAEKKALKAPDKKKLLNLASVLASIRVPELKSNEAQKLGIEAQDKINFLSKWIQQQSENL